MNVAEDRGPLFTHPNGDQCWTGRDGLQFINSAAEQSVRCYGDHQFNRDAVGGDS